MVTGCTSTADTQKSANKKDTVKSESTVDKDEKKTYKYRMAMYNDSPWNDDIKSLDYYKKMFPDLDIDLVYVEKSSADEKMNLMISSGDIPDVMQFGNKDMLYNQGVYGCWTEEFFREHAPNISKMIDETDPMAWEYAKYDGKNMYSIPGWNINTTYPRISVYNKKWLEAVGEEVPKTIEDAERVFYKFTDDDPDQNGKKDTYGLSEEGFMPVYGAYGMQRGVWLKDSKGNLVYGDVMPEAKKALETLQKWYKDGVIDPEFITGEAEGGYWALSQPLNKDKIGYTAAGWFYHWNPEGTVSGTPGRNYSEFKALNPDGELAYGVPLIGPEGKSGHVHEQPMNLRTHFSKALCEDEERFGRLLEFVDYVNGSDMAGDMQPVIINGNGIENKDWEWKTTDSGKKVINCLHKPGIIGPMGWGGTFNFVEGNGSLEYQKLNADLTWADDITKDYPDSYVNELYTTLDSAGKYKAELDKLLDEGYIAIITGEKPLDYFDEMVKLWYKNGGQEMTDEANKWFNTVKDGTK